MIIGPWTTGQLGQAEQCVLSRTTQVVGLSNPPAVSKGGGERQLQLALATTCQLRFEREFQAVILSAACLML